MLNVLLSVLRGVTVLYKTTKSTINTISDRVDVFYCI